jgi:hypothetical protein
MTTTHLVSAVGAGVVTSALTLFVARKYGLGFWTSVALGTVVGIAVDRLFAPRGQALVDEALELVPADILAPA